MKGSVIMHEMQTPPKKAEEACVGRTYLLSNIDGKFFTATIKRIGGREGCCVMTRNGEEFSVPMTDLYEFDYKTYYR